jgi:hypothetical protein
MRQHGLARRAWGILATLVVALAVGVPVASADDIDTTPAWDGVASINEFGHEWATPTYGQTITGTGDSLASFTVYLNVPGTVTFQGGVGVWDGSAVSSVLWTSPDSNTTGSGSQEPVTFQIPDGVTLAPGQVYVIYASTLDSAGSGTGNWGFLWSNGYDGGKMVWQNGESLGAPWDGNPEWDYDLAFIATFLAARQAPVFVPMPVRGGYCTVAGNTNPFTGAPLAPGTFVDLRQEQVLSDPSYKGVVPAIYVDGVGLTCDAPPAGFTQQGLAGEKQQVGGGMYPYYTKSS